MCSCIGPSRLLCGVDVETPHLGARLFTEPLYNNNPGAADYLDVGFSEYDFASFVAESADADEVVCEGTHDVAVFGARWQMWK